MENLLSLAFDNLSTFDGIKIRKGIRQIETLLSKICLPDAPASASASPVKKDASSTPPASKPAKDLAALSRDPAFREFFKLQEGFEWNVTQRLLPTLEWLFTRGRRDGNYDMLIVSLLDLLQGVLLLHPPSKVLFSRQMYMNLLLDLIQEPTEEYSSPCPSVQNAAVITLVVVLLDAPQNTRVFEQLDGMWVMASLFKSRESGKEVKFRVMEFLYFYLAPEVPFIPKAGAANANANGSGSGLLGLQSSPSKLAKVFGGGAGGGRRRADSDGGATLSVEDKKHIVEQYLPGHVDQLLRDLDRYKPFGGALK